VSLTYSWTPDKIFVYKHNWYMKNPSLPGLLQINFLPYYIFMFHLFSAELFSYRLNTVFHILSGHRNLKFLSDFFGRKILSFNCCVYNAQFCLNWEQPKLCGDVWWSSPGNHVFSKLMAVIYRNYTYKQF
jgi:hypothetical protein